MQHETHLHESKLNGRMVWVCDDAQSIFQPGWFDLNKEIDLDSSASEFTGRCGVHRFEAGGHRLVLRHYFRGGIPAHVTKDRFVFRGWHASRPYREICLLLEMRQAGLPVPSPVAAQCVIHGLSYSADLIMHELPNTTSLASILERRSLISEEWYTIGKTVRRFHRMGFQHVDLNARNILIDQDGLVYLIDFDRCVHRTPQENWTKAGLQRLRRSLAKISAGNPDVHFAGEEDFQKLLQGYAE